MAATAAPVPAVLHPRSAAFTVEARGIERRIALLFAATGIALAAVMGVLGLLMRLTQATVLGISPAWFYRLMTLHGAGMLTGTLLAMMGALWYVLHESVPLRVGWMLASYALIVAGALGVLVATLIGGFGAGWTFLPALPFHPAGSGGEIDDEVGDRVAEEVDEVLRDECVDADLRVVGAAEQPEQDRCPSGHREEPVDRDDGGGDRLPRRRSVANTAARAGNTARSQAAAEVAISIALRAKSQTSDPQDHQVIERLVDAVRAESLVPVPPLPAREVVRSNAT